MKDFAHIKILFILLTILFMSNCKRQVDDLTSSSFDDSTVYRLTLNDTVAFSYKVGDTIKFIKYKSVTNEKRQYILISKKIEYAKELDIWPNFTHIYMYEGYKFKFIPIESTTPELTLFQFGENAYKKRGVQLFIDIDTTRYSGNLIPIYDTLLIDNTIFQKVCRAAVPGGVNDLPLNGHVLFTSKDGIIRIRPTNNEIWDLKK